MSYKYMQNASEYPGMLYFLHIMNILGCSGLEQ